MVEKYDAVRKKSFDVGSEYMTYEGRVQRSLKDAGRVFEIKSGERPKAGLFNAQAMLPEDERYIVEEQAGMHEDSGLDRSAAESAAFSEFWRKKHCP